MYYGHGFNRSTDGVDNMNKNSNLTAAFTPTLSAKLGSKPLGKSKAAKFSLIEGLTLDANSTALTAGLTGKGLQGDALRAEIGKAFAKKLR